MLQTPSRYIILHRQDIDVFSGNCPFRIDTITSMVCFVLSCSSMTSAGNRIVPGNLQFLICHFGFHLFIQQFHFDAAPLSGNVYALLISLNSLICSSQATGNSWFAVILYTISLHICFCDCLLNYLSVSSTFLVFENFPKLRASVSFLANSLEAHVRVNNR